MQQRRQQKGICRGIGQLTLVEHALCPLDSRVSLRPNLSYETQFNFSDSRSRRRSGQVVVHAPRGLSANDELFLWGLLALTLADSESDGELCVTRHYLLRELGMINAGSRRGGKNYDQFSSALRRLACVHYENDSFYDPIRAEHRRVSFGFLSYSLPLDAESSRAWRIVWDPLFFELAKAAGGALRFDWQTYRELDSASRRLYLFVSKLFARRERTHAIDLRQLAVNVLGFSSSLIARDQKAKVARCIRQLAAHGIVLAEKNSIRRTGVGKYVVVLAKGAAFNRRKRSQETVESPLVEPLTAIGFEAPAIRRILKQYPQRMVREWVDITQAASERFGGEFFKRSPMAYLTDNLQHAARGERTPPDWWHDIRKAEERARAERLRERGCSREKAELRSTRAMETLGDVQDSIFEQFRAAGQPEATARKNADSFRTAKERLSSRKRKL